MQCNAMQSLDIGGQRAQGLILITSPLSQSHCATTWGNSLEVVLIIKKSSVTTS